MKQWRVVLKGVGASVLLAVMNAGCHSTPKPIFLDPDFKPTEPAEITIMPVVDIRKDKTSADLDLGDLQETVAWWIDWENYSSKMVKTAGQEFDRLPAGEIARLKPAQLAQLAPPEAKSVLFFFVEDASYTNGFVYKNCRFEAYAVLIDRQTGRLLWKNKYAEAEGWTAGGLLTCGIIGLITIVIIPFQYLTVSGCISTLTSTLPEVGDAG